MTDTLLLFFSIHSCTQINMKLQIKEYVSGLTLQELFLEYFSSSHLSKEYLKKL